MEDLNREATKIVRMDLDFYLRTGAMDKAEVQRYILNLLYKQTVIPVTTDHYVKGKCYACGNIVTRGSYCSNCGQRLE